MRVPIVLSVAGSDPSGGAGLQQDLRVFAAAGVYGTGVPTALTVQDSGRVHRSVAVGAELVGEQLRALLADVPVDAVKTGMLVDAATVAAVGEAISGRPWVCDPVISSSSGAALLDAEGLAELRRWLPRATLATPNAAEAALLLQGEGPPEELALGLWEGFGCAALVTGGDADGDEVLDVLADADGVVILRSPRVRTAWSHGTGCTLSSAVAAALGAGADLREAVAAGRATVRRGLQRAVRLGAGGTPWVL